MSAAFQVTFDCANPDRLARFWAIALGYRIPDPPGGFETWQAFLEAQGVPREQWDAASACEDPEGHGPRLYFQRVPEGKVAKNRVHLDVNVGGGRSAPMEERRQRVDAEAERLMREGATVVEPRGNAFDEYWVVMQDPEGNEFCLQ